MISDERARKIMATELKMEGDLSVMKPIYNWQSCKFSGSCSAEKFRVETLLKTKRNWTTCPNNPSVYDCKMYQFLENAVTEYGTSEVRDGEMDECGFCDSIEALCLDIEENGWKKSPSGIPSLRRGQVL